MNRKDFFKKLGIGVASMIVAPKVIAKVSQNNSIIWDEDAMMRCNYYSHSLWNPPKPISEAEFMDAVRTYQRYYDEAWRKLECSLMKEEKERVIKDLILHGTAKTNYYEKK